MVTVGLFSMPAKNYKTRMKTSISKAQICKIHLAKYKEKSLKCTENLSYADILTERWTCEQNNV